MTSSGSEAALLDRIPTLRIQRLFALGVVLKLGFAAGGYFLNDPIWLGTVGPLAIMALYIWVGHQKKERDVSEERFADSCYYLGFIFTIVSIIICLVDVPKLTPGKGMYEIAVRFGAAMMSTVFGMIVRVYLISFKKDDDEAVQDARASLIQGTLAFTAQLQASTEQAKTFQLDVMKASQVSVALVEKQVESLGKNFSEALAEFFKEVNLRNREEFKAMLDEVHGATTRLAGSVDAYSQAMQTHLVSIENKVTQFADAVTNRLRTTSFPDDFFVAQLRAPLSNLVQEAASLGDSIRGVTGKVEESSTEIGATLKLINARSAKAKDALASVAYLAEQQKMILSTAEGQQTALTTVANTLSSLEQAFKNSVGVVDSNSSKSLELASKVHALTAELNSLRGDVSGAMTMNQERTGGHLVHITGVLERVGEGLTELRQEVARAVQYTGAAAERSNGFLSASVDELRRIRVAAGTTRATTPGTTSAPHSYKSDLNGLSQAPIGTGGIAPIAVSTLGDSPNSGPAANGHALTEPNGPTS